MRILNKYIFTSLLGIILSIGLISWILLSEIRSLQKELVHVNLLGQTTSAVQLFNESKVAIQNKDHITPLLKTIKSQVQADIVLWAPGNRIQSTLLPLLQNKLTQKLRGHKSQKDAFDLILPDENFIFQFKALDKKIAYLGVGLNQADSGYTINPILIKLSLLTLLLLILSAFIIYRVTRPVVRSIEELDKSLLNAKSGKLEEVLQTTGNNEISKLIFHFNRYANSLSVLLETQHNKETDLSGQLQNSHNKLVKLTDNLERVVAKRTAELRKKDAQLLQTGKLAGLGQLSTGIAHEINQPLNVIKLIITGMLRQYSKNKELATDDVIQELNTINQQTIRVQKIIGHMKTFARKRTIISFSKLNLNNPINDALLLIGQQLKAHDIELELNLNDNLPEVEADSVQIEQILINLINNARDAVELKEALLLEKGHKDYRKKIEIETYFKNEKVQLKITDNGSGMTEEIREQIFEPFFSTKETKGTGLGMAITYNLVKNMNGDISVVSELAKGTTFLVSFPDTPNLD